MNGSQLLNSLFRLWTVDSHFFFATSSFFRFRLLDTGEAKMVESQIKYENAHSFWTLLIRPQGYFLFCGNLLRSCQVCDSCWHGGGVLYYRSSCILECEPYNPQENDTMYDKSLPASRRRKRLPSHCCHRDFLCGRRTELPLAATAISGRHRKCIDSLCQNGRWDNRWVAEFSALLWKLQSQAVCWPLPIFCMQSLFWKISREWRKGNMFCVDM